MWIRCAKVVGCFTLATACGRIEYSGSARQSVPREFDFAASSMTAYYYGKKYLMEQEAIPIYTANSQDNCKWNESRKALIHVRVLAASSF